MYTRHYGLREKPFALTPDPRFLFLSASHREALAHLLYGIEQGEGFIAVTGEVGTGKTTLCRTLLERIGPDAELAYLFNPRLTGLELLEAIHRELGLPGEGTRAQLLDRLNRFLLDASRAGRRVLLLVDEAQNLPVETLEELRLLSNLETTTEKLLQIVLFGQPELDALLDSPQLRQLRQRIGVRWRLDPLSEPEASDYVRHRLRVAAGEDAELFLFSPGALRELRRRSRGIPRLVNLLADRALLAGYADGSVRVERAHVGRAAREILRARQRRRGRPRWRMLAGKRSD
jgi:general secretion pathway protein A